MNDHKCDVSTNDLSNLEYDLRRQIEGEADRISNFRDELRSLKDEVRDLQRQVAELYQSLSNYRTSKGE